MAKITPMSGFPEWLPAQRALENVVLETCRDVFELHGFASIETRAVETLETLLQKGEIDKEVYGVRRLNDPNTGPERVEDALALHFDLTVPFARYVVENAGKLEFPFRRHQIQKVWRGERPQDGRYREFLQADIDIVGRDALPFSADTEAPLVMAEFFARLEALGLPRIFVRVNNRKVCEGFYRGLGFDKPLDVLRIVDKLDKIGPEKVGFLLNEKLGATPEQIASCMELTLIKGEDDSVIDAVRALGVEHELLDEGLQELGEVLSAANGVLQADLSIARGLDYYTGTVFESTMVGYESLGSVCSGGRYDKLATDGRFTYPGVGISVGISRILGPLFAAGYTMSRSVPTCVYVALTNDDERGAATKVAATLRKRGIPAQVSASAEKFGKQIKFADKRGIPFVWFIGDDGDQVKDIRSGEQVEAHRKSWEPPLEDLHPQIVVPTSE